mmetsp:Transcript_30384/g.88303  ORF Transcript_30384/g.88303 Transcript_30384/m.88303 type:complete len:408 (+) Transcript_30384:944-2167(+)
MRPLHGFSGGTDQVRSGSYKTNRPREARLADGQQLDGRGGQKPGQTRQTDDVATLIKCLWEHGLCDHGEHRPRGQALGGCDDHLRLGVVRLAGWEESCPYGSPDARDDDDRPPHAHYHTLAHAVSLHSAGAGHGFGEVGQKDAQQEAQHPAVPRRDPQDADHNALRDAVDQNPQPNHHSRILAPVAPLLLATSHLSLLLAPLRRRGRGGHACGSGGRGVLGDLPFVSLHDLLAFLLLTQHVRLLQLGDWVGVVCQQQVDVLEAGQVLSCPMGAGIGPCPRCASADAEGPRGAALDGGFWRGEAAGEAAERRAMHVFGADWRREDSLDVLMVQPLQVAHIHVLRHSLPPKRPLLCLRHAHRHGGYAAAAHGWCGRETDTLAGLLVGFAENPLLLLVQALSVGGECLAE